MNILTWVAIGYCDLKLVSLTRMQGKNIFGLVLNLRIIIIIVATIVAADAHHLFQGVPNIPSSQVIYIHRSKN